MSTLIAFGNLEKPFERMARSVLRELVAMPRPVVIQAGANHAMFHQLPAYAKAFTTCGFEEFEQLVAGASVVITHGGAGTIHATVSCGLRPAVFVRRGRLGEHIDDHQVEWCGNLFVAGLAAEMADDESLAQFLVRGQFRQSDAAAARKFFDCSALKADLQGYIRSVLAIR